VGALAVNFPCGTDGDGYPVEGTAYRFYCDRCGSFRVGRFISPVTRLGLLLACGSAAVGWYRLGSTRLAGAEWVDWWAIFALFCVLVLAAALAYHRHVCRKCGNTSISNEDVLRYSDSGGWTYDVPSVRFHTHEQIRGRWYKELFQLLGMIAMVPVVMAFVAFVQIGIMVALVIIAFRGEEGHDTGRYNRGRQGS